MGLLTRAVKALESISNSLSGIDASLNESNSMDRIRKEAMCKHDLERIEKDALDYKKIQFLTAKKSLGYSLTSTEIADLETYNELRVAFLERESDTKVEGGDGC